MDLDDIAAQVLYGAVRESPRKERVSVIYEDPQSGELRIPPIGRQVGSGTSAKGAFSVPHGSLRAMAHQHPKGKDNEFFSPEDIATASRLGIPSYVEVMNDRGGELRKFDPRNPSPTVLKVGGAYSRGEPVLAQIPIAELAKLRIAETMK